MSWKQELDRALRGKTVLILCVGNDMKGDDAVGRYVYDNTVTRSKLFCGEMPENYIGKIKESNPEVLLIVDAVHSGGKPGEIVFARAERLQPSGPSTHSLSFTMLAKTLPGVEVFILGVQPESVEFGEPMSPEAKGGAELVAKALDRTLGILK